MRSRIGWADPRALSVSAALATAAAPHLPRPARRAAWVVVLLAGLAAVQPGGLHLLDAAGGAALGWATAAALHLLLGTPGTAPTAAQVAAALRGDRDRARGRARDRWRRSGLRPLHRLHR